MNLKESGEMYLETIYLLSKNNKKVRSLDIATSMGFSKPSVSRAVHLLEKDGYITIGDDGYIDLTESGYNHAHKIYERHTTLTKFLEMLEVPCDIAENDACKMEHVISDTTLEAIKKFIQKQP